jgi:tetratricopeptide (TPR) repeat protein
MFHHETADTERFERVILESVRRILAVPTPDLFLDWARERIPSLLGLDELDLDPVERQRLANLLGTAVWNATPQPTQGFRPVPLPSPDPKGPCPCGSGDSYRDCCGAIDDVPVLSADLIWELLLDELPERSLDEALALGAVPPHLLAKLADRWLEERDRPGRATALLEPLFEGPLGELGPELEPAFDVLCDAYDRLDHWRKKLAFLGRLCAEGSRPLKAAAWQRLSTMHIDEGDFARAEEAFGEALRADPDNPGTALLEITMLAAQHKDGLARERARFWLFRLRRAGFDEEGFMDFLARAVEDPQAALVDSHSDALDPVLMDLHGWVALACARPVPNYGPVALKPPSGRSPLDQLGLFDEADLAGSRRALSIRGLAAQLRPPQRVRRIETLWRSLFPAAKPYSTQLSLHDADSVWLKCEWSDYLLCHPEAADSLDVLDDLATALYEHPESALPWVAHALLRPLLERAGAIVAQALPADAPYHIPWSRPANRPALRLLFRLCLCQTEEGQPQAAARTLESLLKLNPQDNHGVRAELMNHYLRSGEDEQALSLARRFPDDALADLAYGEVLALYRLGEQERARAALRTAASRLPRIPQYLTRKRIKQPRLGPLGATPGGDDQAWMYREAMRDVWEAEPGLLKWLKRVTA